jgi:DNA-binding protein HU-beta
MNKLLTLLVTSFVSCFLFAHSAYAERTDNLVRALAKQSSIADQQAEEQIHAVFSAVQEELRAGREVNIRKFGRFWVQDRNARQGRNPKTGAPVQIPAKKYPKFSSSDVLKTSLNTN